MSILKTLGFLNLDAGEVQIVDEMTVVPLLGEDLGEVAEPLSLKFKRTDDYGSMVYENTDKERSTIIPTNIMVRGLSAQDHAMAGSGVITADKTVVFKNACCIESSQGGYLSDENNDYDILPIALRKKLIPLSMRNDKKYDKLWSSIKNWLKGIGVDSYDAHLRYFYDNPEIKKSLEIFSAEFEPLLYQIGAIILFKEKIVGIEIMPTIAHWSVYWKLLIRGCYGSELIRLKRLGRIKPSELEMPIFPKNITDPEQLTPIVNSFTANIRKDIIKKLNSITLKHTLPIDKIEEFETVLLKTSSGGGGDLITQNDKSIYLSMVI